MSQRIETAEGAARRILSIVQKRRYLKNRSIPPATCIRSSIPEITRNHAVQACNLIGQVGLNEMFLNPQSSSSLHCRQSTRVLQKF